MVLASIYFYMVKRQKVEKELCSVSFIPKLFVLLALYRVVSPV